MAEAIKNKLPHWIKDHAGFWSFGILVVAILGLLGGIGVWALESQERKIMAVLTAEDKRLDTRIDGNTELLKRIDKKIDRVDQKIEELSARVDEKIDNLSSRMDQKIDGLSARMDKKIDNLSASMDQKIDNLSARMDTILDRLPAR